MISTMDKEFYEKLKDKILKQEKIYEFNNWHPTNGPEVEGK
jgi:hypothetical protein